jgi:hypothetical protein
MSRCSNSDEVYVKAMLPLRRGYPLPAPQPISSLPVEKRRVGTIIGDVGTIRDDGSFDYLFNPLLPTTDPRNPDDLPTAFNILPPVAKPSQKRSAINSRTAVCSRGSHCDTNRETMYALYLLLHPAITALTLHVGSFQFRIPAPMGDCFLYLTAPPRKISLIPVK